MDGKKKLEELVTLTHVSKTQFGVLVPSDTIRSISDAYKAMEDALRDIASSDDIENALDPARNKRIACAALKGSRHEG